MTYTFKLAHRLAQNFWVVGAAAALAGCVAEKSVTNPVSTPIDTTTVPTQPQPRPAPKVGYFVAANGIATADGSINHPWDMNTAVAGGNGKVHAGDTIWVRGGTYFAPFRTSISGNAGAPVVLRAYPGEHPVIDGGRTTNDNF